MKNTKIDTAFPVPDARSGGRPGYPFKDLQVGESFFAAAASINMTYWRRTTGFKFTARRVTEDGQVGHRVWRVA